MTRTHAQIIQLISFINSEIDFSFNDKLAYFANRFRNDLRFLVAEAEVLQDQKIKDLIYAYAQTSANGIIKKADPVFNDTLKMYLFVEIAPEDLTALETAAATIISDTQTASIEIVPFACPETPSMANLSSDFIAAFDGILLPAGYTPPISLG